MAEILYDPECGHLATLFLAEWPSLNTPENIRHLAQEIQQAIEDWIAELAASQEPHS